MKPSDPTSTFMPKKTAFWHTLRFRFSLWVAGLLLVVLVVFSVFVYFNLRMSLLSGIDETLRLSATQTIATSNIQNGQVNFSDSPPDGTTATDLQERGLTIRILSPDGKLVEAFGPFSNLPVSTSSLGAGSRMQATITTVAVPSENDLIRLYSEPVLNNGQLLGVIQVAQSLGTMYDTLSHLLTAILLAAPLLVGVAGIGGYYLAARALDPIDQMTLTAQRISAEDLSARIKLPETDDEVGRLAATFDNMLTRLDDAFRRERRFTADASHELRTPLTAMQAIISVIRQERRNPPDYEQALDDLAEETDRLRSLTEDLLNLAQGDLNRPLELEEVDLTTLLVDLIDSLRPLIEDKGLRIITNISEHITITGDRDSLIRLFANLLDNAIKFTSKGGITLSTHSYFDNMVEISIRDSGEGIPPEDLPYIFDRFYQVEKSRASGGAGLGLAMAEDIVKAHQGSIEVSSRVGQGTTFYVRLPVSSQYLLEES